MAKKFQNRPVRQRRVCFLDGEELDHLPSRTLEMRYKEALKKLSQFWNTPLRDFWKRAYIHYRDLKEKGGSQDAPSEPPADNHDDGKPAA